MFTIPSSWGNVKKFNKLSRKLHLRPCAHIFICMWGVWIHFGLFWQVFGCWKVKVLNLLELVMFFTMSQSDGEVNINIYVTKLRNIACFVPQIWPLLLLNRMIPYNHHWKISKRTFMSRYWTAWHHIMTNEWPELQHECTSIDIRDIRYWSLIGSHDIIIWYSACRT